MRKLPGEIMKFTDRATMLYFSWAKTLTAKALQHIYLDIGGSRGGGRARRTPPMGPNSFVFTYIFTKKCPRWRSTPPPQRVHAPLREILDPPLLDNVISATVVIEVTDLMRALHDELQINVMMFEKIM